jgi:hypothetical protein
MVLVFGAGWLVAKAGYGSEVDPASLSELERDFAERMQGASLVGRFTVTGREDRPARPDRYDIESIEKVGEDQWRFNSKIGYSGSDVTVPLVVTVRWAGDTPMITLTDFNIPTMGTFTTRVFFYRDHYAGTWSNERGVGGHMFGRIERAGK